MMKNILKYLIYFMVSICDKFLNYIKKGVFCMSVEHNFTFIFKDANGDLQIMYPRTVAQQVLLQSGQTMADHVNDNDYHLLSTEESMMKNANRAGGLLQLDTKRMKHIIKKCI